VSGDLVWTPLESLVVDVRHVLAHAPRQRPDDRFEAWAWRALLDEDGPGLLTRQARPNHLTASAIVLSPNARQTCLVLHARLRQWVQPGGHLEPDDAILAVAAAREVEEETGLTGHVLPEIACLSRHVAPCAPGVDYHLDVQFVLVADVDVPTVSVESHDVAWFGVGDLPDNLAIGVADSVLRAVEVAARTSADA
jgi:8-oxo-dGTP pyrophosphatase MutT (NUDIX family)